MYDAVFISYNEPDADERYKRLLERYPNTKRIHGVKGIHQAHIAAAKKCSTKMFWVIDGDADLLPEFNLDKVSYSKKIISPTSQELENHKIYLKNCLKKNFFN